MERTAETFKGKLLISMPILSDPNFRQSVVLICEHNTEGALGLILNRPTEVGVSALIEDFPKLTGSDCVYAGGPVAKNGMLILCRSEGLFEGHTILKDVFLAKDLEELKTPGVLGPNGEIRCYLGYAGWAAGQLEGELEIGAWRPLPADSNLIFDAEPTLLWPQMMRRLGTEWAFYATLPLDPSMN
ncbi:MAG: YqgE/AlgH family protein [Nitrospirae bacterium]|nr:YqgE/AlgH family protein [Candidatus Manganitrophaceae bacterium]